MSFLLSLTSILYILASRRPTVLVRDVTRKYEDKATFPVKVSLSEISRACMLHEVPQAYLALMPEIPLGCVYNELLDPRRATFNASTCLNQKRLLVSVPAEKPLDNVYKCKAAFILDKIVLPHFSEGSTIRRSQLRKKKSDDDQITQMHLLDQIAAIAVSVKKSNECCLPSPMQFLENQMKNRARVRVVIRKLNGLRGYLDGDLICFDKHFNMVLRNAVDSYSTIPQVESDISNAHLLSRRLPLLLVRGDNVVLVSKCPPNSNRAI